MFLIHLNKYSKFWEHNNEMLKKFLNEFKFNYNFKSSTELYKSGFFNSTLKLILEKYQSIMDIIFLHWVKKDKKHIAHFCQYVLTQVLF